MLLAPPCKSVPAQPPTARVPAPAEARHTLVGARQTRRRARAKSRTRPRDRFVGNLMAGCLRSKERLALSLPPYAWHCIAGHPPAWAEYARMDPAKAQVTCLRARSPACCLLSRGLCHSQTVSILLFSSLIPRPSQAPPCPSIFSSVLFQNHHLPLAPSSSPQVIFCLPRHLPPSIPPKLRAE